MDVTLVSFETKATRFNIVRSSTLFTFGYPNLILSLLQYISFHFNVNIATFVGVQINGICILCAAYFYHTQAQVSRVYA